MTRPRSARAARVLLSVLLLPVAAGCRGGGLDVQYPEARVNRAALASAPPRRVEVGPVADRRMDTTRIGVKPKNGGDIVTSRPVTDIVREALVVELGKNGHSALSDGPEVVLAAAVEDFRLDEVRGHPSTRYVGRVAIALSVVDGRTAEMRLTRRYVGIKRTDVEKASDDTWRETMDAALARAMHDLATDPELARALGSLR